MSKSNGNSLIALLITRLMPNMRAEDRLNAAILRLHLENPEEYNKIFSWENETPVIRDRDRLINFISRIG